VDDRQPECSAGAHGGIAAHRFEGLDRVVLFSVEELGHDAPLPRGGRRRRLAPDAFKGRHRLSGAIFGHPRDAHRDGLPTGRRVGRAADFFGLQNRPFML